MRVHVESRPIRISVGAVLCAFVFPCLAAAQNPSLAEIAKREAERRKTVKQSDKVITAKDLPESARKPAAGPAAAAGDSADATTPETGAEKPAAETQATGDSPKDENYWRSRMTQAQESVRRNETFAEALQSRINGLTLDYAAEPNQIQRIKIGDDRQKALDELTRVKRDIDLGKQQIADIEDEARKAGVPPGWLR